MAVAAAALALTVTGTVVVAEPASADICIFLPDGSKECRPSPSPSQRCETDTNPYVMTKVEPQTIWNTIFGRATIPLARMTPHLRWCHLPGQVLSATRIAPTDLTPLVGNIKMSYVSDGTGWVSDFIGKFTSTAQIEVVSSGSATVVGTVGWAIGYACSMTIDRDYYPDPWNPRILNKDFNTCAFDDAPANRPLPVVVAPIGRNSSGAPALGVPRAGLAIESWRLPPYPPPPDSNGSLTKVTVVDETDPNCQDLEQHPENYDRCRKIELDLPAENHPPSGLDGVSDTFREELRYCQLNNLSCQGAGGPISFPGSGIPIPYNVWEPWGGGDPLRYG